MLNIVVPVSDLDMSYGIWEKGLEKVLKKSGNFYLKLRRKHVTGLPVQTSWPNWLTFFQQWWPDNIPFLAKLQEPITAASSPSAVERHSQEIGLNSPQQKAHNVVFLIRILIDASIFDHFAAVFS